MRPRNLVSVHSGSDKHCHVLVISVKAFWPENCLRSESSRLVSSSSRLSSQHMILAPVLLALPLNENDKMGAVGLVHEHRRLAQTQQLVSQLFLH